MSNVTKEFSSLDTGSPTLTGGTAGSIITVLDALLINGYNSTTATSVTVSGGVATYNIASNTYTVGQCLLIAGGTGSYTTLNGEMYVTAVTSTSFSFATAAPNGTATGTVTAKVAPMGWTAAFTGTNIKAYQQGGGQNRYMQIDSTSGQLLKYSVWEAMTAINTGINQAPTSAQSANFAAQLATTTATTGVTKNWYAIGNDRSFYFFISPDASTNLSMVFAGDYMSYKSGDLYNCMVTGASSPSLTSTTSTAYYQTAVTAANATPTATTYVNAGLRPYTGVGSSQLMTKLINYTLSNAGIGSGTSGPVYPNAPDGSLILSQCWLGDGSWLRGEMPGMQIIYSSALPFAHYDTLTGAGATAGKFFRAYNVVGASGSAVQQILIQRLAPWSY